MKEPMLCVRHISSRKKGKKHYWSKSTRYTYTKRLFAARREVLHLPTRRTLTYAEAQHLVDIDIDGSLHRLNITEPLTVVTNIDSLELITPQSVTVSVTACDDGGTAEPLKEGNCRLVSDPCEPLEDMPPRPTCYYRRVEKTPDEQDQDIEYDIDEQDLKWLSLVNTDRQSDRHSIITVDEFEFIIDRLEKESFIASLEPQKSSSVAENGRRRSSTCNAQCAVCLQPETEQTNVLLVCDSCSLTVHQECYGVPYIPDGCWLCRPCLRCSPDSTINCCLCPVVGGAMKQTDDGQFAHVICARWVPEVRFGSATYLEPVEHINKIPVWRRKLTCSVCGEQGVGACVRCEMPLCETAFHATCAQRSGVYMRLLEATTGSRLNPPRRTIFCDLHRPVETSVTMSRWCSRSPVGRSPVKVQQHTPCSPHKPKMANKNKKTNITVNTLPPPPALTSTNIPVKRLAAIANCLSCVRDKQNVLSLVHSYWLLKRQAHNGWPLLHRLYSYILHRAFYGTMLPVENVGLEVNEANILFLRKLRQDMEKVRLLMELVCKREKLKSELLSVHEIVISLELEPLPVLLRHTLNQLQAKDTARVFAEPVDTQQIPDYVDAIKCPMDFSTMQQKIETHKYLSVEDFEADFKLMISNCLQYNGPGSTLHSYAQRLQTLAHVILCAARRMSERANYDKLTGQHNEPQLSDNNSPPTKLPVKTTTTTTTSCSPVTQVSLENKLKILLSRLDVLQVVRSHRNVYLARHLRRQIGVIRRTLTRLKQATAANGFNKSPISRCVVSLSPLSVTRNNQPIISQHSSTSPPTTVLQTPPTAARLSRLALPATARMLTPPTTTTTSHQPPAGKLSSLSIPAPQTPRVNNGVGLQLNGLHLSNSSAAKMEDQLNFADSHRRVTRLTSSTSIQSAAAVDSLENDSSYESSYSVLSDSDVSNDNVPAVNGVINGHVKGINNKQSSKCATRTRKTRLETLHRGSLVWAKTTGYPWYPAMVFETPDEVCNERKKSTISRLIPVPPRNVLLLGTKYTFPVYLVRYFNKQRNWQWLPRHKLDILGHNETLDSVKLNSVQSAKRKCDVKLAYDRAIECHIC